MAADRRAPPQTGSRPGPAAGPGRDPADAGPARLGVPVPGRGTGACTRFPTYPRSCSRIRSSAGRAARRRAVTDAGSRYRGRSAGRRSGSGRERPTSRSWPGVNLLSVEAQERDPASTGCSTATPCTGAASCRPPRTWSGCPRPAARCCISPALAAGAAWPTSAPDRFPCPRTPSSSPARRSRIPSFPPTPPPG